MSNIIRLFLIINQVIFNVFLKKRSDFIKKIKTFSQSIDSEEADFRKKLGFLLLLSSVALMSFQFPDESFDSIIELFQAKDEIFGEPVAKVHKKRKTNDGTAKNVPNTKAIAILVDLLVSLLTKAPSNFFFIYKINFIFIWQIS